MSNFSFCHNVFKSCLLQKRQKAYFMWGRVKRVSKSGFTPQTNTSVGQIHILVSRDIFTEYVMVGWVGQIVYRLNGEVVGFSV